MILHKFLSIRGIEESWVYQDIFTKGAVEAVLRPPRLGRKKLGEPDERMHRPWSRPSTISRASTSCSTPSLRRRADDLLPLQ